jgi:predicted lipoprotein
VTGKATGAARGAPLAALLVGCTTLAAVTGCRVVRDDDRDKGASQSATPGTAGFDPAAYAASVWGDKVLPYYEKEAVAVRPVLEALAAGLDQAGARFGRRADAEGSPWTFTVRGAGRVVSLDTASRAGTLVVTVETGAGPRELTLQVGPVVRGTAIRDSLPFFSFGAVTNQIEFAQVARALNDRAMTAVKPSLAAAAPGAQVEFLGAMNLSAPSDPLLVTPVALQVARRP